MAANMYRIGGIVKTIITKRIVFHSFQYINALIADSNESSLTHSTRRVLAVYLLCLRVCDVLSCIVSQCLTIYNSLQ